MSTTPVVDLEEEKKRAEIDKLRAEILALNRPLLKPTALVALLVAAGGILSAVTQWQVSDFQQERAALEAERKLFEAKRELAAKQDTIQELNLQSRQKQTLLAEIEASLAEKARLLDKIEAKLKTHPSEEVTTLLADSRAISQQITSTISTIESIGPAKEDVPEETLYWVVVASIHDRDQATQFVAKLNKADPSLHAFVGVENSAGFYPVIVGSAVPFEEAQKLKRQARKVPGIKSPFLSPE
jgi:chromosome segregation ATPase